MAADIRGPVGDQLVETLGVTCEQRADRFLEMRPVAGHRVHETIGGLLREADAIGAGVVAPRLVDQFADRDRGAALLLRQPVPMPRQQRDLARDDAELWAARSARRGRG